MTALFCVVLWRHIQAEDFYFCPVKYYEEKKNN